MKTQIEDIKIGFLFSIWKGMIEYSNANSKTDPNKDSERILLRIFKILYDPNFEDLNQDGSCGGIGKRNFPGADIGRLNGECYSITSKKTTKKIIDGLEKFKSEKLLSHFPDGIKFFILDLGIKKPELSEKLCKRFSFTNSQVINFLDLAREIELVRERNSPLYDKMVQVLVDEFVSIFPTLFATNSNTKEVIESIKKGIELFSRDIEQYEFRKGFGSLTGINGLISDLNLCSQDGDSLWPRFAAKLNSILFGFNQVIQDIDSLTNQTDKQQLIGLAQSKYQQISRGIDRFEIFLNSADYNPEARTPVKKSIRSIKAVFEKYKDE